MKNASSRISHYVIISFCACTERDPALLGAEAFVGVACTAGLLGMLWFCLQSGVFLYAAVECYNGIIAMTARLHASEGKSLTRTNNQPIVALLIITSHEFAFSFNCSIIMVL